MLFKNFKELLVIILNYVNLKKRFRIRIKYFKTSAAMVLNKRFLIRGVGGSEQ